LVNNCSFRKSDFMHLDYKDGHFDCAYAIEATCHAPDKVACFAEVMRVVKPGGLFACYEWVMTSKYDKDNAHHRALKEGIEVGNGLPDIATIPHVLDSLKKAGWEVLDHCEMSTGSPHEAKQTPWYNALEGSFSLTGFRMTSTGRAITHAFVTVLQAVGIAPAVRDVPSASRYRTAAQRNAAQRNGAATDERSCVCLSCDAAVQGSVKVSKLLNDTANDLVNSGKLDIFTPSFFFLARKPIA
jgi:sterol 24-C-methyltransferase